jgi:hypothetical protein
MRNKKHILLAIPILSLLSGCYNINYQSSNILAVEVEKFSLMESSLIEGQKYKTFNIINNPEGLAEQEYYNIILKLMENAGLQYNKSNPDLLISYNFATNKTKTIIITKGENKMTKTYNHQYNGANSFLLDLEIFNKQKTKVFEAMATINLDLKNKGVPTNINLFTCLAGGIFYDKQISGYGFNYKKQITTYFCEI